MVRICIAGKALAVKEVKPVYSEFVADRDGLRSDECRIRFHFGA